MPSNTKAILANSLTALIKTRTLDQIKIKDITDPADLIGKRFIIIFMTYMIFKWIVRQELEIILTSRVSLKMA